MNTVVGYSASSFLPSLWKSCFCYYLKKAAGSRLLSHYNIDGTRWEGPGRLWSFSLGEREKQIPNWTFEMQACRLYICHRIHTAIDYLVFSEAAHRSVSIRGLQQNMKLTFKPHLLTCLSTALSASLPGPREFMLSGCRLEPGKRWSKDVFQLRFNQGFKNNLTDTTVINMSACLPHLGSYSRESFPRCNTGRTWCLVPPGEFS